MMNWITQVLAGAIFGLSAVLPAHATLPQDAVIIVLKDAKVTLKRQYRDVLTPEVTCPHGSPATCIPKAATYGPIKTALVGRYPSAYAAKEAMRLLPPLRGGLMYRIDIPEAYANVIECIVPQGSICTDAIDSRLHFVP